MQTSLYPHTFHIPVMGTGFTIDTPLKVARYGISSVISLVDDVLIDQMRKYYCQKEGEPYEEITDSAKDARAARITHYLNLVHKLVNQQVKKLQASPFSPGSEITQYFDMLPDSSLKREYLFMLSATNPAEKMRLQEALRPKAVPGSIDVNIMTKLDRNAYNIGDEAGDPHFSDAMAALRGFGNSTLESSIVFSAGLNPRLYSYAAELADFLPQNDSPPKKKIILKVGDFRSAEIQGKFLAKRGLWVSEYRIESSLNCGGHAFSNMGNLLGPILQKFKENKRQLFEKIYSLYIKVLAARGIQSGYENSCLRITVQGGIGTQEEDRFLQDHFEMDGTGWGTPFLLVPEATNVDDVHLKKLSEATEKEVYLSNSSPLNVPFWCLRTSASEEARRNRIRAEKPGSACPKGYLAMNSEFSKIPLCTASYAYQKLKLKEIRNQNLSPEIKTALEENVLEKACICHDLAGSTTLKYGIDPKATPTICCGPNIINFSKIASLREMIDHIYGRTNLMTNPQRKHLFIQELLIYMDYLIQEIERAALGVYNISADYLRTFKQNMLDGIEYYKIVSQHFLKDEKEKFLADLWILQKRIETLSIP